MNERIRELWVKAAKTTQGDSWEEQTKFMEKFVELIVRECAELNFRELELSGSSSFDVSRMIKQHFGVE